MGITSANLSALVVRVMRDSGVSVREMAKRMGFKSHSKLLQRLDGTSQWLFDELPYIASSLKLTPEWIIRELQGDEH